MTAMQLQKLVYYSQAWAVASDLGSLFPETTKAWANGPVVPELWHRTTGAFTLTSEMLAGDTAALTVAQREHVDRVVGYYGEYSADYLSQMTHAEVPWKAARESGERAGDHSPAISIEAMRAFYAGKTPREAEDDFQVAVAMHIMDRYKGALEVLAR